MYNGFSEAKRREDHKFRQNELRRSLNSSRLHKAKMKEMSDKAADRRHQWLGQARQNVSLAECKYLVDAVGYHEGALALKHEKHYEFRTREARREISPRNFHNYTYKPDKEKSQDAAARASELYFKEKYTDKTPNFRFQPRDRTPQKELQPLMRFTDRTTKDRVCETLRTQIPTDQEPIASKLLFKPEFRATTTEKWLSPRGFVAIKGGSEQSWEEIKQPQFPESYANGLQSLGETLQQRERVRDKEIASTIFSSVVSQDPWRTQMSNSASIRSYHALSSQFRMRQFGKNVMQSTGQIHVEEGTPRSISVPPSMKKRTYVTPKSQGGGFLITAMQGDSLASLYTHSSNKKIRRYFSPSANRNYEVTDSLTDRDFATLLDGEKLYMQSAQRIFPRSPGKGSPPTRIEKIEEEDRR